MIDYMYEQLLNMEYISANETPVQVLHESGQKSSSGKSCMWVYMPGRSEEKQMVLYNYEESRRHEHAVNYLKKYKGTVSSDGYQAYDKIDDIVQAGCWAHTRRYFKEALELMSPYEVRSETLSLQTPNQYPIPENKRIKKYKQEHYTRNSTLSA